MNSFRKITRIYSQRKKLTAPQKRHLAASLNTEGRNQPTSNSSAGQADGEAKRPARRNGHGATAKDASPKPPLPKEKSLSDVLMQAAIRAVEMEVELKHLRSRNPFYD